MNKEVICESCGYRGTVETYMPCLGYNDIRCPKCGSTNNEHNAEYLARVFGPKKIPEDSEGRD